MNAPALLAVLLALALASAAPAQSLCSHETLMVENTPLAVTYCVAGSPVNAPSELDVPVKGTYSTARGSIHRTTTLRFVTGAAPARVLQNVGLAPLGLRGTLHLTLVYRQGTIRVEGALLTPGAITIK
jgi:hypothetical protein